MSTVPATPIAESGGNTSVIKYFEHTWVHGSENVRSALRLDQVPQVKLLKALFGSVIVDRISVEVVQLCEISSENDDAIAPNGVFFVGLIPSGKDTDAQSGKNSVVVYSVPKTAACPLSSSEQKIYNHELPLAEYETDLALDPRRQQAVVLWSGNAGYRAVKDKKNVALALVRWKVWVSCSGNSALW